MNHDPYQTPRASLDLSRPPELDADVDIPEDVLKRIRHGSIAGLVSIAVTLVATLVSLSGAPVLGLDAWALLDVAVMAGLVYGIHRKSRVCAVLMLLFFGLNKLLMWAEAGTVSGLPIALILFWYYGQAIRGTFEYHRIVAQRPA